MAEYSAPFNSIIVDNIPDRAIDADRFGEFIGSFFSEGVFNKPDGLSFDITENGDMSVTISDGRAFLNNKWYCLDAPKIITLEPAHGTLHRIDAITIRKNYAERKAQIIIIKGVSSTNPIAPRIERDPTGNYDLQIYQIRIRAGATSINRADITDMRLNNNVCGVVVMNADHIDTTTLYNQVQGDLNDFRDNTQTEYNSWTAEKRAAYETWILRQESDFEQWDDSFKQSYIADFEQHYQQFKQTNETKVNTWFANLKNTLDENQAANLYNKIDSHENNTLTSSGGVHGLRISNGRLQGQMGAGWATLLKIPTGMTAAYFNNMGLSVTQFNNLGWTVEDFNNQIMIEE